MSDDLREVARYIVGAIDRQTEAITEQSDTIASQTRMIGETSMSHGIDWSRVFENTGGLVDTASVVTAIEENTAAVEAQMSATERLANALEDFNALYSVVNHVQDVHSDLLATHE